MPREQKPLHVDDYENLSELDLDAFPVAEGFHVVIKRIKSLGHHAHLHDRHGFLAGFPWWDSAKKDLLRSGADAIPIGTIEQPYDDLEQGWQSLIFEQGDMVYVLEGTEPLCHDFSVWFAVPRDEYFEAWMQLIDELKGQNR